MERRLKLQSILEELLESKSVYYQSPESIKMSYPAIRYTRSNIRSMYANDAKYSNFTQYEITVIDTLPDNPVIEKILKLPRSSFNRHYISDNLNHDTIILYF